MKKCYSGFKYYPNVITYGECTQAGLPTIFGGYEYTPIEINNRKNELLEKKHIEAYSVLPSIFKNNGYDTTLYNMKDLALSSNANFLNGLISSELLINGYINKESYIKRASIFSFFLCSPVILQRYFYNSGNYFVSNISQIIISDFVAKGESKHYIDEYDKLDLINSICKVVDNDTNNYVSIYSCITHPPFTMLQTPDYLMNDYIDNSKYFNESDFLEDTTFMTLADVSTIFLKGLIDNPVNPFTGKKIDDSDKKDHNQLIAIAPVDVFNYNSKYIKPYIWYSVHDNIYDINNWEITHDKHFLDTYELPINDTHSLPE